MSDDIIDVDFDDIEELETHCPHCEEELTDANIRNDAGCTSCTVYIEGEDLYIPKVDYDPEKEKEAPITINVPRLYLKNH
jgi:hypothetical protein